MSQYNEESGSRYPCFSQLGDISIDVFLRDYWQKKPLIIRNAFPNFESPISADELAGLSLEDDVVSRLIVEKRKESQKDNSWSVEHGPIDEARYSELSEKQWTLLVQHVDSLDPNVNKILNAFRFIPNWRLDDIMVSYAADAGGVGPHFDYFDVFLLQAEGKRRWRTGQHCDTQSELVPNQAMKILENFDTVEDWICEPGDLLYIPAQTAHWGEAVGECMTYSIGFRAPSDSELLLDYSQNISAPLSEDNRYRDSNLQFESHPGEITQSVVNDFHQKISDLLNDKHALANWLAEYSTQLHNQQPGPLTSQKGNSSSKNRPLDDLRLYESATREDLDQGTQLKLAPFNRCVFLPAQLGGTTKDAQAEAHENITECYINGTSYKTTIELAKTLSSYSHFSLSCLNAREQELIKPIVDDQHIMLVEEDL